MRNKPCASATLCGHGREPGWAGTGRRGAGDRDAGAARPGETWAVGAVVLDADGRAFAQRRSPGRRLFPDCWDIVGGHMEPGENLLAALAREVAEETGWRLRTVRRLIGVSTWEGDDGQGLRHEADFVVDVDGDLARPRLEPGKHTAYGWFGPEDLERLKENRAPGETLVHDVNAAALDLRG